MDITSTVSEMMDEKFPSRVVLEINNMRSQYQNIILKPGQRLRANPLFHFDKYSDSELEDIVKDVLTKKSSLSANDRSFIMSVCATVLFKHHSNKEFEQRNQEGIDYINTLDQSWLVLGDNIKMKREVETDGPLASDDVTVDYKGELIDGTVFDENKGVRFTLNSVVPGFATMIRAMHEGETATAVFSSELGYGNRQVPKIPAGSALKFTVTLIAAN